MQYDEFIGDVQHRAQLDSREAALSTTRATLTTLSERIQPGQAENVGAQLPEEIGRHLEKVDEVESFGWDEFVDRVADREQVGSEDREDVIYRARVVMEVVDEVIPESSMEKLKDQLPAEYEDLFVLQETEATAGPNPEE
ncbi:DUF2267 domain-containing protein [Halovivax limisalsi]|uniref:DUF2267 domain-containing protein n=1 Tax=Halovivax limisalsi TaxID=1453760 RepID=UPI001FFD9951|nr:DUF2267 domain-containing protein [Halovivax limisalsi]